MDLRARLLACTITGLGAVWPASVRAQEAPAQAERATLCDPGRGVAPLKCEDKAEATVKSKAPARLLRPPTSMTHVAA